MYLTVDIRVFFDPLRFEVQEDQGTLTIPGQVFQPSGGIIVTDNFILILFATSDSTAGEGLCLHF